MADLFLNVLNTSITAGYLVVAVAALRLLLKKAPRWTIVLLWAMVALRLLFPFSIESVLSLVPSAETVSPEIMYSPTPTISSGIHFFNATINPVISQTFAPTPSQSVNPMQVLVSVASIVWLVGMGIMLLYSLISYWRLRRKVATAIRQQNNIFRSERVASAFVLGFLRPRIYLPYQISERDTPHVIAHEQAHIRRKDHWWKPLGFLLLTIHWFNPLMWLAYALLCRDIELACDEKVIKELGADQRADYSQTLLKCSVSRRSIAACPLAFGEVGVRERVKKVLHYKRPTFWIIVAALIVCIAVAICFLTDPPSSGNHDTIPEEEIRLTPTTSIWYEKEISMYNQASSWQLEQFPDMTFQTSKHEFQVLSGEKAIATLKYNDLLRIYTGDLNGDGYSEVCVNYGMYLGTFASGVFTGLPLYSTHIWVFDPVTQTSCNLGNSMEGSRYKLRIVNDRIICDKTGANGTVTGVPTYVDTVDGKQLYLAPLSDTVITNKATPVITWYESGNPDYSKSGEWQLEAFPGVTFRTTGTDVEAETNGETTVLINGFTMGDGVYVADLNGDGKPEICASGSIGSGINFQHVVVYDYAAGKSYGLGDPCRYLYFLRVEDGELLCDMTSYYDEDTVLHTGRLGFYQIADGNWHLFLATLGGGIVSIAS